MKKWLNISLVVLAVVVAGVAFYNKQRQYKELYIECDEIKAKYKKLLFEKYIPPYFNATIGNEKMDEIKDRCTALFIKIAEAYTNEQVELMREYMSLIPADYCLLDYNDRNEVRKPFKFEQNFSRCKELKLFNTLDDFERFIRINIDAALFVGEVYVKMRDLPSAGHVEWDVLRQLLRYKKKFAKEGLSELEKSADKFISYWISFIESDNGFTKRCAEFIVARNELIKFIRPDEAKTREESLRSARSFVTGLIRCGYRPKWLKQFEE